ncbi:MAG: hypothetical protein ACPGWR_25955 [Ardenticatenaceae bacterium]
MAKKGKGQKKKKRRKNQKNALLRQKKAIEARQERAREAREEAKKRKAEEEAKKGEAQEEAKSEPLALKAKKAVFTPPPVDPLLEALNNRYDEFEQEEDYEGRIALFFKTMDDELLDAENAFHMLGKIYDQSASYGDEGRDRFDSLVGVLRERYPDVYEEDAQYYLDWMISNALATNRSQDLPGLADQVATIAGKDLDIFYNTVHQFAYHGQLNLIVQMMRQGYPYLQENEGKYFYGVTTEFASRAMNYEIFAYLEEHPTGNASDPALRERIEHYGQDDVHWDNIANSISYMSGQADTQWTLAHFGLDSDLSGDDYDPEDDEMSHNLQNFMTAFLHYLRRSEGISYPKGEQARAAIHEYLLERQAGKLKPRESMFKRSSRSKRKRRTPKADHFFLPDPDTLDHHLGNLMNFINPQIYSAASMYELLPAWLRYLEANHLIDGAQRQKTVNQLAKMKDNMLKVLTHYFSDPAMLQATKNWG